MGEDTPDLSGAIGEVLRAQRLRAGVTLRAIPVLSGGRFSASAVGAYERGERAISVVRFCELAWTLGGSPAALLADALGTGSVSVTLGDIEVVAGPPEATTPARARSANIRSAEPR